MENIGMKLKYASLVIVIISIQPGIVKRRPDNVNARLNSKHQIVTLVLRDTLGILIADHVNVI
jgi:hypothetical protein